MKLKPMQLVGLSVLVGIACVGGALVISVINGGPPDALSEGAFAVLSAAIGAIAGYSVQDKGTDPAATENAGLDILVPATDEWEDIEEDFEEEADDPAIDPGLADAPTEPDFGGEDADWFDEMSEEGESRGEESK